MPHKSQEEPALLRPGQAARRLGVCSETLRRWSVEGAIAFETLHNGHRRYRLEDLEAYLATHRRTA